MITLFADFGYKSPIIFPSPTATVDRTNSEWKSRRSPWVCSGRASTKGRRKCKIQPIVTLLRLTMMNIILWFNFLLASPNSIQLNCIDFVVYSLIGWSWTVVNVTKVEDSYWFIECFIWPYSRVKFCIITYLILRKLELWLLINTIICSKAF